MISLQMVEGKAADSSLSLSCAVCHGSSEQPSEIPGYFELTAPRLELALREFRDGKRRGTAMPRLTRALSDETIRHLAETLARASAP